jgi:hypothetical protein
MALLDVGTAQKIMEHAREVEGEEEQHGSITSGYEIVWEGNAFPLQLMATGDGGVCSLE